MDGVALTDIASQYNTPCYVYSRADIERQWSALDNAMAGHKHAIFYAVKANSNLAILNILARLGSGFDVVSAGEIERVIRAGGVAGQIIFSGVGKTVEELEFALELGIKCFNVESLAELDRLQKIAQNMNKVAPISLRINPNIDADTHPYIATGLKENKFGVDFNTSLQTYRQTMTMTAIKPLGVACHIGSQITSMSPFLQALDHLLQLAGQIESLGIPLQHIDIGGGLGVSYQDETPPTIKEYAEQLCKKMNGNKYQIAIAPGRIIVGSAGILLTRVELLKNTSNKNFAVVDTAMNDLLRPCLYNARHKVLPIKKMPDNRKNKLYDIVGPICETSDFLAKKCPLVIQEGDLLAIDSVGAYGFTMASNYNSRPKTCEIMVDKGRSYQIRRRQNITELMTGESLPPDDHTQADNETHGVKSD